MNNSDKKVVNYTLKKGEEELKVVLWDTAGQERFRTIISAYYRGASGVLLCYSTSDRQSFYKLSQWMVEIQRYAPEDVVVTLVGFDWNKQRQVTIEEGKELADLLGHSRLETTWIYTKTTSNEKRKRLELIDL